MVGEIGRGNVDPLHVRHGWVGPGQEGPVLDWLVDDRGFVPTHCR